MAKARPRIADRKGDTLRSSGCLNPRPERVADPTFVSDEFFDARDLVQVKYEMLRRVQVDGATVATSAAAFGFSRPSFYHALSAFERGGLEGLVPAKPGPRQAHKLSDEVVDYLEERIAGGEAPSAAELVSLVKERFGRDVHARSVERALARRKKKTATGREPTGGREAVTPSGPLESYEALRARVLARSSGGDRHGLALLLREGMPGWIRACTSCAAPAAEVTALGTTAVPAHFFDESGAIVTLLVGMALSTLQETCS